MRLMDVKFFLKFWIKYSFINQKLFLAIIFIYDNVCLLKSDIKETSSFKLQNLNIDIHL